MQQIRHVSGPQSYVVMSAYNATAYLDEAATSILDQTFRGLRIHHH
jgi:glycosyltransferase involved in cell wall biosynthesis